MPTYKEWAQHGTPAETGRREIICCMQEDSWLNRMRTRRIYCVTVYLDRSNWQAKLQADSIHLSTRTEVKQLAPPTLFRNRDHELDVGCVLGLV